MCVREEKVEKRREEKRREETLTRPNKEKRAKRDFLQFHFRCATAMSQEDVIITKEITKKDQQRPSSPTSIFKKEKTVNKKEGSLNESILGGEYSALYPKDGSKKGIVSVTTTDLDNLEEGQMLAGNCLNSWLTRTVTEASENAAGKFSGDRVLLLDTQFFTKFITVGYDGVSKWTKKVHNIFIDKDFILIPIHGDDHWSLAIVTHPKIAAKEGNNKILSEDEKSMFSCILHMDSIGSNSPHGRLKVHEKLTEWLQFEYNRVVSENGSDLVTDGASVINEKTLSWLSPNLPLQAPHSNDCGVFVLLYAERFIKYFPAKFTKKDYEAFGKAWFPGNEAAAQKRVSLSLIILQALAKEAPEGNTVISSSFAHAISKKNEQLISLNKRLERKISLAKDESKGEAEDEEITVITLE